MKNQFGPIKVLGSGPLTTRFKLIEQEGRQSYLVWADTMRYRLDDELHALDVVDDKD